MDKMTIKQQMDGASGNAEATDHRILKQGEEIKGQAEQAVNDVFNRTAETVSETHENAKSYKSGKTIFIFLVFFGVAVGLGFLLRANYRRSHTGLLSQPVVKALLGIARKFFHNIVLLQKKVMQISLAK